MALVPILQRCPLKNIVNALHQNGIPAKVSNTAGTFVCNHLMYGVCHYAAQKGQY